LCPGGFGVVGDAEDVLLGHGGGAEELAGGEVEVSMEIRKKQGEGGRTAKLPGAFRAMVHPQPR
jgi:hypothetical protein